MRDTKNLVLAVIGLLVAGYLTLQSVWLLNERGVEAKPQTYPEEASFMLECVYGWDQTPEDCRKILAGEDPPPLPPPPDYEQGC